MNKGSFIDTVVVLGDEAEKIGQHISQKRPDLEVHGKAVDKQTLQGRRYAIIAFNPGPLINDYADARWVHCSGAGADYLLDVLTWPVPLMTRTVGRMGDQIAEYVLAYLLYFGQRIAQRNELQRKREWQRVAASPRYLNQTNVLVFGTGSIGCAVAKRLTAMGMNCVGVSRQGKPSTSFAQVIPITQIQTLALKQFNSVVLALPGLGKTRSLIDSSILERFEGAILINVGRAQVLCNDDLLKALDSGCLDAAILDVFEQEPLSVDSPFWAHPKITVTPHVSGLSQVQDVSEAFLAALERQEAGLQPELLVSQSVGY